MIVFLLLSLFSWNVYGVTSAQTSARRNWEFMHDFGEIGLRGAPKGYCITYEEAYDDIPAGTTTYPAEFKQGGCEPRYYGAYLLKFVRDVSDNKYCAEYSMLDHSKSDDSSIWCAEYQLQAQDMPWGNEWCLSWKYAPANSADAWKEVEYELKHCDTTDKTQIMTVFKGVATFNRPASGKGYNPSLRSIDYSNGESYTDDWNISWTAFHQFGQQGPCDLVLKGFALVGFGILIYGAGRHYTKDF